MWYLVVDMYHRYTHVDKVSYYNKIKNKLIIEP